MFPTRLDSDRQPRQNDHEGQHVHSEVSHGHGRDFLDDAEVQFKWVFVGILTCSQGPYFGPEAQVYPLRRFHEPERVPVRPVLCGAPQAAQSPKTLVFL